MSLSDAPVTLVIFRLITQRFREGRLRDQTKMAVTTCVGNYRNLNSANCQHHLKTVVEWQPHVYLLLLTQISPKHFLKRYKQQKCSLTNCLRLTSFQNPHLLSSSLPIRALFVFAVSFLPSFNALSGYCCFTKFDGTSLFEFRKISSNRAQSDKRPQHSRWNCWALCNLNNLTILTLTREQICQFYHLPKGRRIV